MTSEEETIDNIRRQLECIVSARESSRRITGTLSRTDKIEVGKSDSENFTVGALHVKSKLEASRSRSQVRKRNSDIRDESVMREGQSHRRTNAQGSQKRLWNFENREKDRYEPRQKFRKNSCVFCEKDHFNDECTTRIFKEGKIKQQLSCRLLLDCGSQRSYVTSKIAKELDLPIIEENYLSIFTFGAKDPQQIESPVVCFMIITRTNIYRMIYANVVPHITQGIQCPNGTAEQLTDTNHELNWDKMIMADDGSICGDIDLLIGNYYYYTCMSNEKLQIQRDFGLIWSGRCRSPQSHGDQVTVLTYFQSNTESGLQFNEPDRPLRNDNLKLLWDLELIGIIDSPKTTRDEEAVKLFNDTTQYVDGRYYVKWPWIEYPPALPTNFALSLGRLTNLLRILKKGYSFSLRSCAEGTAQ